jgi:hypothetical protein
LLGVLRPTTWVSKEIHVFRRPTVGLQETRERERERERGEEGRRRKKGRKENIER